MQHAASSIVRKYCAVTNIFCLIKIGYLISFSLFIFYYFEKIFYIQMYCIIACYICDQRGIINYYRITGYFLMTAITIKL